MIQRIETVELDSLYIVRMASVQRDKRQIVWKLPCKSALGPELEPMLRREKFAAIGACESPVNPDPGFGRTRLWLP